MMAPWWSPFGQVPEISTAELHERLGRGAKIQLLDVRTRREFAHGHITGAVNVPIQSFRRELPRLGGAARAHGVRKAVLVAGVTIGMAALMAWALRAFGARSAWFALAVVWLPLGWFALLGRILALRRPVLRLPARVHALRAVERDGRVYELLGVRVAKWLLRRGPLAVGAPDLHLPTEPTPANLAVLDERMRQAEAIHEILLVVTLAVAAGAAVRGWWAAAGWLLLFNILFNAYPAMLQRYNRALLTQRFALLLPLRQPQRRAGRRGRTQDSRRYRPFHA